MAMYMAASPSVTSDRAVASLTKKPHPTAQKASLQLGKQSSQHEEMLASSWLIGYGMTPSNICLWSVDSTAGFQDQDHSNSRSIVHMLLPRVHAFPRSPGDS